MKHEVEIKEATIRLGLDGLESFKKYYTPTSVHDWYFKVVEIPTVNGEGPCSYPECDSMHYEVWDSFLNTIACFTYLGEAIQYAIELNEALSNEPNK